MISAIVNRAIAHTELGNYTEARDDVDTAVELGFDRGVVEGMVERVKTSANGSAPAAQAELTEAEKRYNAGVNLSRQGRWEAAIAEYDEAIRLDTQVATTFFNRGSAHDVLSQWESAIQDYDRAIELNPTYLEAYGNQGYVYLNRGEYQRAVQNIGESIRLDPPNAANYVNRAIAYTYLGNDIEAQEDVDRAVERGFERSRAESKVEKAKTER